MDASYIVPLRRQRAEPDGDLAQYLEYLHRRLEVIVVDGSPADAFASHHRLLPGGILHIPVDPLRQTPNGKVGGVLTGLARASHFLSQRIRQAYDELARPLRLMVCLAALPCLAEAALRGRWLRLALATGVAVGAAEIGRRRAGGAAVFRSPRVHEEITFEALLWRQLRQLHQRDRAGWDASVSSDPADSRFAFSFAGRAFFVVGLHPQSSRLSRRFELPTLVFNARFQFERLKTEGRYGRVQEIIRARDRDLQGTENPMLSDFGTRSEARQYSGRAVDERWTCPFHPAESNEVG